MTHVKISVENFFSAEFEGDMEQLLYSSAKMRQARLGGTIEDHLGDAAMEMMLRNIWNRDQFSDLIVYPHASESNFKVISLEEQK